MCNILLGAYVVLAPFLSVMYFEAFNDDVPWQNRVLYGLFLPITLIVTPFVLYHKTLEKVERDNYIHNYDIEELKKDLTIVKNNVRDLEARVRSGEDILSQMKGSKK